MTFDPMKLNREPAKIAIVSSAPHDWRGLTSCTWKLMAEYAQDFGYHFYTDESNRVAANGFPLRGFVKFDLLSHCLPKYEWVVWLDADLVLTNRAIRLEKWTNPAEDHGKELILEYDANGHHSTVIFARNSVRMRDFLWACNNAGKSMFLEHPWHEMEAMRYFMQTPPYNRMAWYVSAKELCAILHTEYEKFGMPADVASDYAWEPGDFALHLSALSLDRRITLSRHFADPSHWRVGMLNTPE